MNNDINIIGSKLRIARRYVGDSQMDVAVATGLSLGTVNNIETGRIKRSNRLTCKVLAEYVDDICVRLDDRARDRQDDNTVPTANRLREILDQVA